MRQAMVLVGLLLLALGTASAQQSTSFKLEEYTLNAGGTPSQGTEVVSASFRMTVASIGDTVSAAGLGSASFQLDSGFAVAYPPPGEVAAMCGGAGACLAFTDLQTLIWPTERSAGHYNLYRDDTSDRPAKAFPLPSASGCCARRDSPLLFCAAGVWPAYVPRLS